MVKKKASATGKSLDDFRAAHDKSYIIPKRLNEALEKLGESWMYEIDFCRMSGVSTIDLASYREEFEDFWVEVSTGNRTPKRVWCGTKAFANKLREMS